MNDEELCFVTIKKGKDIKAQKLVFKNDAKKIILDLMKNGKTN